MNASDLFKSGRLRDAIDAQLKEVKANPADPGKRMFLFELLAFGGDLERARKQLTAVQFNDPEEDAAVARYHRLLDAEVARRRLFSDGQRPQFFLDPPAHLSSRLQAVDHLRGRRAAEAKALLDRLNAECPPVRGVLDGTAFEGLRDEDDLLGSVLEVFSPQGEYYWLPLEQLEMLAMNPPKSPRDLLWAPAMVQVRGGPAGHAWLPTLYPGTHEFPDDPVRLGRVTEWLAAEGGPVRGAGMHTFRVGDQYKGLLEWRQMEACGPSSSFGGGV